MEKVLRVADMRDLEKQVSLGEISYGRMVELINEKAFITYCNVINNKAEEIKHLKVLVENKNAFIETLEKKAKTLKKNK